MKKLSLEEKKKLAKELLAKKMQEQKKQPSKVDVKLTSADYETYTYDMFMNSIGANPIEMKRFNEWVDNATNDGIYSFEAAHTGEQDTEIEVIRRNGERLKLLNLASYNYLGYGIHPEVKQAVKDAVDQYGLGANSSPVLNGTLAIHQQLEQKLLDFFGFEDYGVSLFSSGYGVNLGTVSAFIKPGGHVVLDRSAHMSLLEGAELSKGKISYFRHNDAQHLEEILQGIANGRSRILVCVEGVYSADGDYGNLKEIITVAKKYNAYVLVDEAHSFLLAGATGKGACEELGVLDEVDMIVLTFSKSMSGVGGALIARKNISQYVNWYAKCRMFSCAIDPPVTGGMLKVLELAMSKEGELKRKRIIENARHFRTLLKDKVDLGLSESWIVPILYGDERKTLRINDYLQRHGLDASLMQFPAVPKNEARIRIFITSEHTKEQLDKAAHIIINCAEAFDFQLNS